MSAILTPCCPLCEQHPAATWDDGRELLCGNDECPIDTWNGHLNTAQLTAVASAQLAAGYAARQVPLQACPSRAAAETARVEWAEKVTTFGLQGTHGVYVRFIRTGHRSGFWGVFLAPHGTDEGD